MRSINGDQQGLRRTKCSEHRTFLRRASASRRWSFQWDEHHCHRCGARFLLAAAACANLPLRLIEGLRFHSRAKGHEHASGNGRVPQVRTSVPGTNMNCSNAFTRFAKSSGRGFAQSFSSQVRWCEPGAPVRCLENPDMLVSIARTPRQVLPPATSGEITVVQGRNMITHPRVHTRQRHAGHRGFKHPIQTGMLDAERRPAQQGNLRCGSHDDGIMRNLKPSGLVKAWSRRRIACRRFLA
jgi:hypothetical protein